MNRTFHRAHLLLTASRTVPHGTEIGRLLFQYADGQAAAQPIVFGENCGVWILPSHELALPADGQLTPAWHGDLLEPSLRHRMVSAVYRITWENPHPENTINSVIYQSALRGSSPILVAMTVDE